MIKINVPNRDAAKLNLVSEDGKLWKFQVDDNHKYVLEYMRLGYMHDNKTIEFVDPSGGPFLKVGYDMAPGKQIVSICEVDGEICIVTK